MNLARQRSLRQGRHQSETRCVVSRVANPHEEEQSCGHPQPKNWRATGPRNGGHQPKNWTGRCYFLTLSAPTCSSWTLAVTCPRSCVAVVQWFGAWYFAVGRTSRGTSLSIFVISPLLPVPSLLSSVLFRLRAVVLCTTHTGCLLITTVALCTIEACAATNLPDPNVFRSRLPAFLSSSPSVISLVLLVPTDVSSRAVVLCTTHTS